MNSRGPATGGKSAMADSARDPAPILDIAHLSAQTCGDQALQREILALFIAQTGEILATLGDPAAAPPAARADLIHKLIGSARAIGAFDLVATAEAAEAGLGAGHSAPRALQDLPAAGERALAAVQAHLAVLAARGD
jgi:HPt (histidine-containing phosphotransfer) domain-containing protein